jgi:hypothetical protein
VAKLVVQYDQRGNMSKWVSDLRAIARNGLPLNCTSAATRSVLFALRAMTGMRFVAGSALIRQAPLRSRKSGDYSMLR